MEKTTNTQFELLFIVLKSDQLGSLLFSLAVKIENKLKEYFLYLKKEHLFAAQQFGQGDQMSL
jgi:hypothetical protein